MLDLLPQLFAATLCAPTKFFLIPSWYEFLNVTYNQYSKACEFNLKLVIGGKVDLTALTLVALGILDILLRLAALVAVGYIIYAGFKYITANGDADKIAKARGTIINALIGLAITIGSAAVVSFIGVKIGG